MLTISVLYFGIVINGESFSSFNIQLSLEKAHPVRIRVEFLTKYSVDA